ncbi:Carbohydrate-Responsive Element-Binding Protein [Manis pentadactyla]|nr:Carbohydrate-Responsive Element-Binding Protein [Manis pentadactyla]
MRCKPGGKPEAEKPPGMAESPEGLEVAGAEVKAPMETAGKVNHLLENDIVGNKMQDSKPCPSISSSSLKNTGKGGLFWLPTMDEDLERETWRAFSIPWGFGKAVEDGEHACHVLKSKQRCQEVLVQAIQHVFEGPFSDNDCALPFQSPLSDPRL